MKMKGLMEMVETITKIFIAWWAGAAITLLAIIMFALIIASVFLNADISMILNLQPGGRR